MNGIRKTLTSIVAVFMLTPAIVTAPLEGGSGCADAADATVVVAMNPDAEPSPASYENQPYPEVVTGSDRILRTLMTFNRDLARMRVTSKQLELLDGTNGYADPAGHKSLWNITLNGADGTNNIFATATFDGERGNLIRFNWHDESWKSDNYPSKALANRQASSFLRLLCGEQFDKYRLSGGDITSYTGSGDGQGNERKYYFRTVQFQRLINGIPLLNSGWTIDVDANGRVINAYNNDPVIIDETCFPFPEGIKTAEEVSALTDRWLQLRLTYMPADFSTAFSQTTKAKLVYGVDFFLIDAKTGEPVPSSSPPRETIRFQGADNWVIRDQKDARNWMKEVAHLNSDNLEISVQAIPDDASTKKQILYSGSKGNSAGAGVGDLQDTHAADANIQISLMVDSETGKVTNFYVMKNGIDDKREQRITAAQARSQLIKFLSMVFGKGEHQVDVQQYLPIEPPEWVDRARLPQGIANANIDYNYSVNRRHQGVQDWSNISVMIDGETGTVQAFSHQSPELTDRPDPSKAISLDKAKQLFLQKVQPPQLIYEWPEFYGQRSPQAHLRYMISPAQPILGIDAITGEAFQVK
ncbi:YcdB/YcdC domain-containing protein [Heliophilum fasciatum]|uniref:YcdB/YcdC repeated domain-containing protein n=1 Tax=Heliophilum fasciatum TaxID=35700 RepID=A0A4R2RDB1_9FIRM|nr:YcdB/YcdC domain-containing protein [Heliophilum fasciatum]MCW2279278.1 hypothetical protein [Heliophilum fasciatum]TCP60474.1 hypothetical protein EDD73_1362 [Heliophilum fasciatum]